MTSIACKQVRSSGYVSLCVVLGPRGSRVDKVIPIVAGSPNSDQIHVPDHDNSTLFQPRYQNAKVPAHSKEKEQEHPVPRKTKYETSPEN